MTLPEFLEPANARITIPAALAVGYACYHWWRWRMMHPKIVIEDLPEPAPEAKTVVKAEGRGERAEGGGPGGDGPAGEKAKAPAAGRPAHTAAPAANLPQRRASRWQAWREQEMAAAQFDFESCDPGYHERACRRAYGGRPECFVRLGEYAWRRGAMVETHFWVSMAKFHGVEGLDEWLAHIRTRWVQSGRPVEQDNVYDQYPFERGALAYAYLMYSCGFSVAVNRDCIADMARFGDTDAQLIMEKAV